MKWFETIKEKTFEIYKEGILKYPLKQYNYIQLNWTGQGFGLWLSTTPKNKSWEYLPFNEWNKPEWSIESNYREIENIPSEEYDKDDDCYYEVEFERKEWPYNTEDCFEIECFLMSTILGLTYLKLKKDKELLNHLFKIEVIDIYSVDREIKSFNHYFPKQNIRKKIVDLFVGDSNHQKLILDLWKDELKNLGKDFLNSFNKEPSATENIDFEKFKKTFLKAKELYKKDKEQKAIDLLEPELKLLLNQEKQEDLVLIERSCGLLGGCYRYIKKKNYDQAVYWYKKGLEFIPYGYSALNLMNLYKTKLKDFGKLVDFGEQHLEHASKNGKDFTFHSYSYLAYGYVQLENEKKATELYKKIQKLFDRDIEKINKIRLELEEIKESNSIAKLILKWFKSR